jgi:uncharacterized SAM-binding protein YcdF (DUF218 family)
MDREILELAQVLWDYHTLNQPLEKSDCILTLGSYDTIVAKRSAELYQQGLAPLLIFSGKSAGWTEKWPLSEARTFANIAIACGVPKDHILIEERSTNTGENIEFTKQLLADANLDPQRFIIVQKPYMERRAYTTFKKRWPEKDILVTSPQLPMEEYFKASDVPTEYIINGMVGDLQRIKEYPARGFSIPQEIPDHVWSAYTKLIEKGYTTRLIKD